MEQLTRRGFFRKAFGALAGVAIGGVIVAKSVSEAKAGTKTQTIQNTQNDLLKAMETKEGREALARSMVEPIRKSLEYQGVGRSLLMVDELPQGALARYERDVYETDVNATCVILSRG